MSWKDESEPSIKYCLGTAVGLVERFITIQNPGHNRRTIPRTNYLHVDVNDIIWRSTDNEQECIANATLVSLFAKRCPAGRWSFLGPGSEKKWYSTHESKPQGEWDRIAELMMIKFGESGHPVFRATSPLSRGTLKNKGGGQLSIHFCADGETVETVFRTIISVNQFLNCVKSTVSVKLAEGHLLLQSNPTYCARQQTY